MRLKNAQNLRTCYKNIREVEERRRTLHKITQITCFLASVCQCNIAYGFVQFNLDLNLFCVLLYSFLVGQGRGYLIKCIYASGWFVRMEKVQCRPNTNNYA